MKTFDDLYQTIDAYMKRYINGDDFEVEQDFEDDIRKMLEEEGFNVLPKACVRNAQAMFEGVSNVKRQIPDIAVNCVDGQAYLELKFCRTNTAYGSDIRKVNKYLSRGECDVAGVLFLDDKNEEWKPCLANSIYTYFWELYE